MPCTSAVRRVRVDLDARRRARRRRARARRSPARGRNRLEVRLASRTGAPAGMAAYDARSRVAPAASCCAPSAPRALTPTQRTPDARVVACGVRRAQESVRWRSSATASRRGRRGGRRRRRRRSRASAVEVGGGELLGLGEHDRGLEAPGARGDRHRDADPERGDLQRRQVDGGGGVGAAVGVADGGALGGAGAGAGGAGEGDQLGVLGGERQSRSASFVTARCVVGVGLRLDAG